MNTTSLWDAIIIGAGASGLMCAATAAQRGKRVLVLEHGKRPGRKILISGGGRCNFTNRDLDFNDYISGNRHFCKSALSRFTPRDFIALVDRYGIDYHEKGLGQLFCDDSAKAIVDLLLGECAKGAVNFNYQCTIQRIELCEMGFHVQTSHGEFQGAKLVIASGGLSMPKLGATAFGWQVAEQFGLNVRPPRAGLVPLTLHQDQKQRLAELAGISLAAKVSVGNISFQEQVLFTHRGLSGPAILQISSYWQPGDTLIIDWLDGLSLANTLRKVASEHPKQILKTALGHYLPKRVVVALLPDRRELEQPLAAINERQFEGIEQALREWSIVPNGTEGYRTAEVTLGGVSCDELSSKTMEAKGVPGLYFIGEVVDVTGHLGGFNFQWAWSSAVAAGAVL